jgi:DNA-binding CsgD family transcriptional regulator
MLQGIYASLNDLCGAKGDTVSAYRYLQTMYEMERTHDREGIMLELFRTRNEIEHRQDTEKLEADRRGMLLVWLLLFSAVAIAALVAMLLLRRKGLGIRRREADLKNRNEISLINQMRLFRNDRVTEDAIDKLTGLLAGMKNDREKEDIRRIIDGLRDSKGEEHWKELRAYVPEFDSDFFQNLIKTFPDLTVNESRLSVLLNRNLATKQIAEITRQSPESINVARTRLRKKLGISGNDISIQEFLKKFN